MWNSQTRYTLKKLKNKKHVLKRKRKYESRVHVLKHKIKLSIIITTYNSSIFLKDCLKSVCNQIYDDVEIIINKDENITINGRKSSTLRGNIRV